MNPRPIVIASFKTPFIQSLWDILATAEAAGEPPSSDSEVAIAASQESGADSTPEESGSSEPDAGILVIALPTEDSPDQRYIALSAVRRESSITYQLQVIIKPNEAPPENIIAESNHLGGISGLLSTLNTYLADHQPLIAHYAISFDVSKLQYDCPKIAMSPTIEDSEIAAKLIVNSIGFKFENGIHGLKSVMLGDKSKESFFVICDSKSTIQFKHNDLFCYADNVRSLIEKSFFKHKDTANVTD